MSLAEISRSLPTVQDVSIGGTVYANGFVSQSAFADDTQITLLDQIGGQEYFGHFILPTGEQAVNYMQWATWNASYAYPTGSIVRSGGVTYARTGAASTPGAAPPGAGWTALAAPSPLSATTLSVAAAEASVTGGAVCRLLDNPTRNALAAAVDAAGNTSVALDGLTVRTDAAIPTIGDDALVAGVATVVSAASDPAAKIFVQRTGAAPGAAMGVLQVTAKNAGNFVVQSLDPATGLVVAGDVGTFDWWIVNPVYA